MSRLTVLLDMDGVVADFVTALAELLRQPEKGTFGANPPTGRYDCCPHFGITHAEMWSAIDINSYGFWRDLPVHDWAQELYRRVLSLPYVDRVIWCSQPGNDPGCVAGKMQWLNDRSSLFFNGSPCRNFIFTPQKDLLAKPGVVLIDDCPEHCDSFQEAGGKAILFPMPWNAHRTSRVFHDRRQVEHVLYAMELVRHDFDIKSTEEVLA